VQLLEQLSCTDGAMGSSGVSAKIHLTSKTENNEASYEYNYEHIYSTYT